MFPKVRIQNKNPQGQCAEILEYTRNELSGHMKGTDLPPALLPDRLHALEIPPIPVLLLLPDQLPLLALRIQPS